MAQHNRAQIKSVHVSAHLFKVTHYL